MNTERYGVSLGIQSECGKIRTRKTPNTDTFHAVTLINHKALAVTPCDLHKTKFLIAEQMSCNNIQKQPCADVLQNRFSEKFRTSVPESLFQH